ncbi:MAG: hypothetical protein HOY76_08390 [Streptomyces sp.]|nr:hypothetical protein [Streptomyces sp.]
MALPRFPCPRCERPTALSPRGRLYRHDPPHRDPELKSCPGSLKTVKPREVQAVLFAYVPPEPDGSLEAPADSAALLF